MKKYTSTGRAFARKAVLAGVALFLILTIRFGMQVTGAHAEFLQQGTPTAADTIDPTPGPDNTSPTHSPALLPAEDTLSAPAGAPPPPAEDLKAITAALDKAVAARREMSLAYLLYQVRIDHIQYGKDRGTALVWLAFTDPDSGQNVATEPGLALAKRLPGNTWQITLQVDEDWDASLQAVPDSLLDAGMKAELRPAEVQAASGQVFTGYKLPWKGGTYNYVTGSIGHVFTYKSCPNTCLYAFDFADGTMFGVYAARAGRVKYAEWRYANGNTTNTNYLILEDASTTPTTYQVYYHLAQNSIPTALRTPGAVVNQGQYLANADDTGASTGHHLHFHVHTTPNAVWGTSVDIRFDDVIVNNGRPRTCSEASAFPDYGTQCPAGNKLLSGNTSGPAPAVPQPVAPAGKVKTPTPTFQWKAVDDAQQYALTVFKGTTTTQVINQTLNTTVCADSLCSYTPTTGLVDGSYTFKVRAGGPTGWSANSAALAFSTSGVPDVPELVSPGDTIYINNPAYTWKTVPDADRYYLMVYSEKSASYIIYRTVMAADFCTAGTCSYTSTINVGHGNYKFKVRSGNGYGWSAYSAFMPFTAYLAPFPPELTSPLEGSRETVQRPFYRWNPADGATKYGLQVYSLVSKTYVVNVSASKEYLCGATCWYKPTVNLKGGLYKWRMRAYNNYGWGSYSAWQTFTVQLVPDPPLLVSPTGTISTLSPAYTWTRVPGATYYYLMVWDEAAGEWMIYRGKANTEVCREGEENCWYVSTLNVEPGKHYRFKVRAYNSFGWGAFSPEMEFSVQP